MTDPILRTHALTKRFGGLIATDALEFEVRRGEVHAVIGPNGAGKTTLVNQLIGELAPDAGRIVFDGTDITRLPSYRRALMGLSRSYQITSIFPAVMSGLRMLCWPFLNIFALLSVGAP